MINEIVLNNAIRVMFSCKNYKELCLIKIFQIKYSHFTDTLKEGSLSQLMYFFVYLHFG